MKNWRRRKNSSSLALAERRRLLLPRRQRRGDSFFPRRRRRRRRKEEEERERPTSFSRCIDRHVCSKPATRSSSSSRRRLPFVLSCSLFRDDESLKWRIQLEKSAQKRTLLLLFIVDTIHPRSNDGEREHHHDDDDDDKTDDEDARARAQASETISRVVSFIANRLVRVTLVLRV